MHLPRSNLCQKKKKGHSPCLAVCCFSDPLQLSESQRNHYVWEVCSKKQWDAPKLQCHQPASVNRKGPIFLYDKPGNTSHNQRFESWTNWATKFFLICHIHLTSSQPTITSSSTPITFCTKNTSTASRRQKMFSKSSSNPQTDFYATGMNKLISYWQTFWLLLFLFWLIKTCLNLVIII